MCANPRALRNSYVKTVTVCAEYRPILCMGRSPWPGAGYGQMFRHRDTVDTVAAEGNQAVGQIHNIAECV